MKKLFVLILMFFVPYSYCSEKASVISSNVNIREISSVNSKSIGKLNIGDKVIILKKDKKKY